MVMAHELTHALEDQHYDFKELRRQSTGNSDHATAITSVIEGSAMGVSIAYASRKRDKWAAIRASDRNAKQVHRYAKARLPSSSRAWSCRTRSASPSCSREAHGAGSRTAASGSPTSTRPTPDRRPRRGRSCTPRRTGPTNRRTVAESLTLPDLSAILGPGWTKVTEGSIGELGLAVLTGSTVDLDSFESLLPNRWTNAAATGSVGDVYQHYVNGDQMVTVLMTRWETERDAEQFHRAMRETKGLTIVRYGVNFVVLAGTSGTRPSPSPSRP